jgi:hypothetical protein
MALINTITELRKYISIDVNTNIETIQSFIDEAELLYIVDLLGRAFYDEFSTAYAASVAESSPTPLSADNAKLLPYIQWCLAYYQLLGSIPLLSLTIGDMGIRTHRADDSDAASNRKEDRLMFHALHNADVFADKLLEFLEANASVSKYATWYASTANTINSGNIVYNTAVASKHIPINDSRRVFLKIRNKIREIETRIIPKLIGQEQYDELVLQLKTGTSLTPENKLLISKLEPLISKRALYLQLPAMRVQVNENGIFIYSGTDDIIKPGQLAGDADIKILRAQLMDGELGYLSDENDLRQFILDNIENYPLIKTTGVYTVQPDPGPTWRTENNINNKHFGV